tara:strand:- start:158 stop:601 length:444 start_codon:yes stop_codon:yes gene_type:complete
MKRRDFIELSGKAFCACSLTGAGFLLNGCSEDNIVADTTGIELSFDLNEEDFQPLKINGGSVATDPNDIDPEGLLLLRSDENVKAFTRRCTHQGVQLNPFSNGVSICAYGHGAQFNSNGQHISGPGQGSLKSYDTQLDGDILTVFGG